MTGVQTCALPIYPDPASEREQLVTAQATCQAGVAGEHDGSRSIGNDCHRAEDRPLPVGQTAEKALPCVSAIATARDPSHGAAALIPVRWPAGAAADKHDVGIVRVEDHGIGIVEPFRRRSLIAGACVGCISGLGTYGYVAALDNLARRAHLETAS